MRAQEKKTVECYRRRGKNLRVIMGEQPNDTFLIVTRRLLRADEDFPIMPNQTLTERLGKRILETRMAYSGEALSHIHELHKFLIRTHVYTITFDASWKPEGWFARLLRRIGLRRKAATEWKAQ